MRQSMCGLCQTTFLRAELAKRPWEYYFRQFDVFYMDDCGDVVQSH